MSGIHLSFAAAGLAAADRSAFLDRARGRVARLPGDAWEEAADDCCALACVHHGVLPSGGVAADAAGTVAVTGSLWDGPGAPDLAAPPAVLAAWRERGPAARLPWTGVFALAHVDRGRRELTVVSDRFGALPVYWRERGGVVTVSTQLKLLAEPGAEELDEEAFAEFMALGFLAGPRTLLRGIRRLPAHHVLVATAQGVRVRSLPLPVPTRSRPVDDGALAEFDALVGRTLGRFARTVPDWTVALSGGLDSRLLAAAAVREDRPLRGFVAGEPGSAEAEVAGRVAARLGIPLDRHVIDGRLLPRWFARAAWFTEGRALPNHMHYVCANLLGEAPRGALLHGLIGEGVMGGYGDDPALLRATPAERREACVAARHGCVFWPPALFDELFAPPLAARIRGANRRVGEELWDGLGLAGEYGDTLEFKFRIRAVGMTVPNLMSQTLPWADVVSPFLDRDVLEYCNTLEAGGVAGRQLQLRWAERHFPGITAVPRLKDGILIPVRTGIPAAYDRALKRHWRGVLAKYYLCRLSRGRINLPHRGSFPFYGQWYRRWAPVRGFVDEIVLSERCGERGLWRPEGLRRLARSLRHGHNTWPALGTVLLVELFIRQFVEGTDRPEDPLTPLGLDG